MCTTIYHYRGEKEAAGGKSSEPQHGHGVEIAGIAWQMPGLSKDIKEVPGSR